MDHAAYDPPHQVFTSKVSAVDGSNGHGQTGNGNDFCVFTTVRWDPMLMRSPENAAASCNHPAQLLWQLNTAVQQWVAKNPDQHVEALRLKHRVYADSRTATEITPVPRVPLSQLFPSSFGEPDDAVRKDDWEVVLDSMPTEVSETTMYKTSKRYCYDRAREAAGIQSYMERKEVLLWNDQREVMDGSITSVYVWRNGRWVTPESMSGGQQGTTRRWASQQGLCVEASVKVKELKHGELMWLSNASKGYFRGRFVAPAANGDGVTEDHRSQK
ncbi:hypothetical protein B0A50_02493 [Salinomyces thailandicus]|uniref:Uncharacterized protein n=1 Tax=Salinomyces thailandicus TaxID=706561 RepID=A0A4U0U6F7_9PEZI|nr:hypothetical protein B0A50_02493 [Salinomyces thailandica]